MRHAFLATLATLLLSTFSPAQEPIRCARTPDISPDGRLIAFSYLGGIWTVEAIGGVARPVTMHEAYHINPVFSPDGKTLAFTSTRNGGYDVFVAPVQGGKPRRLTFDSSSDIVNGWSPDGKSILFSSTRSVSFPPSYELYTVPVDGGRVRRVSAAEGREGTFSPRGDLIAYVRGPGTWYRKGYRGSSNDDVWISKADGTDNQRLTHFLGQDNSPMWSADGKAVYYVSECFGTPANIVRQNLVGNNKPEQITFHKDDGVRRARISANGDWMVYECGSDLWVVSSGGGTARKLAIEVHADDKSNTERAVTYTSGASEFALSPDEKHVAFVVHGEIFLMPSNGGKATRLTNHPAYDHGIAWAPDGKKIIFASDRDGYEDLYLLEADDPEHREFTKAHKFKVTPLTSTPEAEFGASFAPNGKRMAFIRAGKLYTMNPTGVKKDQDEKVLVDKVQVIDYEWSPDSKWIVYARSDGSFASELYIIPADGKEPARNVTRYATYNGDVTWSATNGKIGFISQRRGAPSACVLSLQKPAVAGAPASTDIDWEDIHLRVEQPAPLSADEAAISPDGSKIAFRSGTDLWVASSTGGQFTRVTTGSLRPSQIRWSKRSTDTIYFRDGNGTLRTARAGGLSLFSSEPGRISFSAKMIIHQEEEFAEMFEQSWRYLSEHFYDPKFHGANWQAVRDKYRPLVKHVAVKEDLYALISLMMGELNASHLGISGLTSAPDEMTAELGLLYDDSYRGPGLKVADILKRGPADRRGLNLKAGEIIVSIDGVDLSERTNISKLLNSKAGDTVVLQVVAVGANPADPKTTRRRVEIQAAKRTDVANLMYDRWVEHNAKRVVELSKGKLGYIHIPSMDEAGLDKFVRSLYSDNFDKEAIVLDVRYNGGGFTHDQVLNYLGAKEHTLFKQRYGGEGTVLRAYDRKWSKPLVLLINNRSYSDAEIFPSAFRTLGLGKLVGQPTGAHVIGTSGIRLIDGSLFRVPRTGVYTVNGVNMEKEGVMPDVLVEQHPNEIARGEDKQLDRATSVLLEDVAVWKKKNPSVALRHTGEKPAEPAPAVLAPASK
jgi:tricorn protease